jgi:hypothetical protein
MNVTKTKPLVINTLPLVFDMENNTVRFKFSLVNPAMAEVRQLLLKLEYFVLSITEDKLGSLIVQTTYTIPNNMGYQTAIKTFYACLAHEVDSFRTTLKNYNLNGYPSQKIITPSFENILPLLIKLYTPQGKHAEA